MTNHLEDLLTESGWNLLRKKARRLKSRTSLNWNAPKCASWVFPNVSNTKRSKTNPSGNEYCWSVVEGNVFLEIVALVVIYMSFRDISSVTEQPSDSQYFWHPLWCQCLGWLAYIRGKALDQFIGFRTVPLCVYKLIDDASEIVPLKRLTLCIIGDTSTIWFNSVSDVRCNCDEHAPLMKIHYHPISGKKQTTGKRQDLKDSEAYPWSFGTAVIDAWLEGGNMGQPLTTQLNVVKKQKRQLTMKVSIGSESSADSMVAVKCQSGS